MGQSNKQYIVLLYVRQSSMQSDVHFSIIHKEFILTFGQSLWSISDRLEC